MKIAIKKTSISFLLTLALCLVVLRPTPGPCRPSTGAVVAAKSDGGSVGRLVELGQSVWNGGDDTLFVLLATGRLEKVYPRTYLKINPGLRGEAWFFDRLSRSVASLHRKSRELDIVLRRKFPGRAPPDTVEDFLIYPVGSAVIEMPQAFKWQAAGEDEQVSFR
ncbi:MAG: hypothetical protein U9N45_04570, partial [Gemmatimonadota bacterium]|nr:hypothetical protein [Gemmatimonadota bacterium]